MALPGAVSFGPEWPYEVTPESTEGAPPPSQSIYRYEEDKGEEGALTHCTAIRRNFGELVAVGSMSAVLNIFVVSFVHAVLSRVTTRRGGVTDEFKIYCFLFLSLRKSRFFCVRWLG